MSIKPPIASLPPKTHHARGLRASCLVALLVLAGSAVARAEVPVIDLEYDTSLTTLNLSGGPFLMPLARDPANLLGDSIEGFGLVRCQVFITLSSQRTPNPGQASLGKAHASNRQQEGAAARKLAATVGDPVDPNLYDGQTFFVKSFFDVFFDITIKDVDSRPGRDFPGMPDGASITLPDNGPANMQAFYTRVFDKNAPNFGLIPPPEVSPYIGHFAIQIPLGGDINGNGAPDKLKFTLASHAAGDANRTFVTLPDGTVLDTFDSAAFLEGAIQDIIGADPPFTIGSLLPSGTPDPASFGGPTTATSKIINPVIQPFDICIQDSKKGQRHRQFLQINSSTGAYLYTNCATGKTYAGTGTIGRRDRHHCRITLENRAEGVRVRAVVDTCKKKGWAEIRVRDSRIQATFEDKDITDNDCQCQ